MRPAFCKAEAQRLRRERSIATPPVDVEQIAEALLIEVVPKTPWVGKGRSLLRRDLGEIWVDARESHHGRRFLIGHEIGHRILHPDDLVFSAHADPESADHADNPDRALEEEADYFSGVLLIPPDWLRDDVGRGMLPDGLVIRYDVSPEVVFIALKQHRLLSRIRPSRR